MFVTRLISGIVLLILAVVTIVSGGIILFGTLLLTSLIGVREIYKVMKVEEKGSIALAVVGYLGVAAYYTLLFLAVDTNYVMVATVFVLTALMVVYVFAYPKYNSEQVMAAFFGFIYVAVMLSYIYQTRNLENGSFLVWLIFLCSWGCDTCAYSVGMLIGKHKMSPVLSPKKSVEGAVGGVIGAALLGGIYAAVVGRYMGKTPIIEYAVICAIGALIAMVGDLAASAIKRNHDIKDYGTLIPGHGGVMDRFDSVIFTAPVIYFLALLIL